MCDPLGVVTQTTSTSERLTRLSIWVVETGAPTLAANASVLAGSRPQTPTRRVPGIWLSAWAW